jgi:hypothetical protein
MMGLLLVAAISLSQADVDSAYNYCYVVHDLCLTRSCYSNDNLPLYVQCRLTCNQTYQTCKADILTFIHAQETPAE